MGNAASREVAKQVQKAAGSGAQTAAKAPRPPPLGRSSADAPDVIEDPQAPLRQRQLQETQALLQPEPKRTAPVPARPPVPDGNSGFFRGQISDPRDVAQEKFLLHQSGGGNQKDQQELAPDLLKFLQDAGPLEKKVNKKLTSSRVLKELEDEGEVSEKRHRMEAATERTQTEMRLVKNIDGHSTTRTTNFFSSPAIEEDHEDFGFLDLEIYELLKRCEQQNADDNNDSVVASFYQEKRGKQLEVAGWSKEKQETQQKLMQNTAKYLGLPVITKDEEASYIGMDRKEFDKEFAHQKLDIVDESRVKLVLADLTDLQKMEIKRIR